VSDVARAIACAREAVEGEGGDVAALERALAQLAAVAPKEPRERRAVGAYRSEVLRRLGRRPEAATAYADALLVDVENAQAVEEGVRELLDVLGGLEEAERVALVARDRHPGRSWQWDALADEARARLRLEREAPVRLDEFGRLRTEVARRLVERPCAHDDDRRPRTQEAARSLGLDPVRVLQWLSALGACCCDCQVAGVAGPRDARGR
jgi:hypothetical protein